MNSFSPRGPTSSLEKRFRKRQGFVLVFTDGLLHSFITPFLPFLLEDLIGPDKESRVALLTAMFGGGYAVARSFCIGRVGTRGRFRMKMVSLGLGTAVLLLLVFGAVRVVAVQLCARVGMGWCAGLLYCHGKRRLHAAKEYTAWYAGVGLGFLLSCGLYDPFNGHIPRSLLVCLGAIVVLAIVLLFLLRPKAFVAVESLFGSLYNSLCSMFTSSAPTFSHLEDDQTQQEGIPVGLQYNQEEDQLNNVPPRYLRGCDNDLEEAQRRWALTVEWRDENNVDNILNEPQPYFFIIKKYYPHFMYKRARNGCVTYYEQVGKVDIKGVQSEGVDIPKLVRHYIFISEYTWRITEPDDNAQSVTVMDLDGVGFKDFSGDTREFMTQCSNMIQSHYVERSNKIFIVNAPSWFSMLWKLVRPLLHENTQKKIIVASRDYKELHEYIGKENMPTYYGGTCTDAFYESELEKPIHEYVRKFNEESGLGCYVPERKEEEKQARSSPEYASSDTSKPESFVSFTPSSGHRSTEGLSDSHQAVDIIEEDSGSEWDTVYKGHATVRSSSLSNSLRRNMSQGSASSSDGGLFGFVKRMPLFGRKRPPVAHLGSENNFYYDTERRQWVISGADEKIEEEEDEGLVKAIQAAHGLGPGQSQSSHDPELEHAEFVNAFPFVSEEQQNNPAEEQKNATERFRLISSGENVKRTSQSPVPPSLLHVLLMYSWIMLSAREAFPLWLWLRVRDGGLEFSSNQSALFLFASSAIYLVLLRPSYQHVEDDLKSSVYHYLRLSLFSVFPLFFLLSCMPWLRDDVEGTIFASVAATVIISLVQYHQVKCWVALDMTNSIQNHACLDHFSNQINFVQLCGKVLGPFILAGSVHFLWVYPLNGAFLFALCGGSSIFYSVFLQRRQQLYLGSSQTECVYHRTSTTDDMASQLNNQSQNVQVERV